MCLLDGFIRQHILVALTEPRLDAECFIKSKLSELLSS